MALENSNSTVSNLILNPPLPSSLTPLKFAARSKNYGVTTYSIVEGKLEKDVITSEQGVALEYSSDGALLAIAEPTLVNIFDTSSGKLISKIEHPKISALSFSPLGNYLLTWERYVPVEGKDPTPNLILWEIKTSKPVLEFVQKIFNATHWPTAKWSSDERVIARVVTNEIHFFEKNNFSAHKKLRLENVADFAFSPVIGNNALKVATFTPERKSSPGSVKIYTYPQFEHIVTRSFFKSEEVTFQWNSLGTACLALVRTDMSQGSYYGDTSLYLFNTLKQGESFHVAPSKGPIHDFSWAPHGKNFVVAFGDFPAVIRVFDLKNEPVVDLASASRNHVQYSPDGRVICVGGFGSLTGSIDFWDPKKLKKIGSCQAACASFHEWGRNARYFLTGVMFSRIKVDNGFTLWNYDGSKLFSESFSELYQLKWQPTPVSSFPDRPISPRLYNTASETKSISEKADEKSAKNSSENPKKYVPPHLRGKTSENVSQSSGEDLFKKKEEGPVRHSKNAPQKKEEIFETFPIGYQPEVTKKKKKKNKNPNTNNNVANNNGTTNNNKNVSSSNEKEEKNKNVSTGESEEKDQNLVGGKSDAEKKIKALGKKLRQIEELKKQLANGKILNQAEIEKMNSEEKIWKEIENLKLKN